VACLENLGYRVTTAVDGSAALALLSQGAAPDILFSDIVMPGDINGWELVERARQISPGLKVLLTSGYALDTLVARGRRHTDIFVLTKPYRKVELAQRLRQTLDAAA
jgi:CheY-like chemotaxis protein